MLHIQSSVSPLRMRSEKKSNSDVAGPLMRDKHVFLNVAHGIISGMETSE